MTIDPERTEAASDKLAGGMTQGLSEGDREARRLQAKTEPLMKGRIVAALLASPLVGSDLDFRRDYETGRVTDL